MLHINRIVVIVTAVACLGVVQFVCLVVAAIRAYPGGAGHAFFGNFLSDLGRSNTPGSMLFNGAIIVLGLSLFPFFAALLATGMDSTTSTKVTAVAGMISALGLIGIGLTPYDRYFVAHHVALALWIGPMFVVVFAYTAAVAKEQETSSCLLAISAAMVIAILSYALIGTHHGYIAMQKATVALSFVWFAMIVVRVIRTAVFHVSRRHLILRREAQGYMELLKHGHRKGTKRGR